MDFQDARRHIRQHINIIDVVRRYVEVKRNGSRWVARCPFHQEKTPSFSVNEDEGLFYCFGCQASGDLFDFYGRINGLDFKESFTQLAVEAGLNLNNIQGGTKQDAKQALARRTARQNIKRMYEIATAHFVANLHEEDATQCREYMERRKIAPEIVQSFGLGWAKKDWQALAQTLQKAGFAESALIESGLLARSEKTGRGYDRFRGRLMFPIRSLSQEVIAFGGRIIGDEDEAKYINSSDSLIYKKGEHLYGLAQARRGITLKGSALLTEGYMDVLTLHQFGFVNAVGVLGTALTPDQVKRLSGFTSHIVLLFDGDEAGRKAALKACEMFLVRGLECRVVLMPDGEDIDSLLHSKGVDAFEELLQRAPEGLKFCTDVLRTKSPRESVEWARNFLQQVEIQELISPFASTIAQNLRIAEGSLRDNTRKAKYFAQVKKREQQERQEQSQRQGQGYNQGQGHRQGEGQMQGHGARKGRAGTPVASARSASAHHAVSDNEMASHMAFHDALAYDPINEFSEHNAYSDGHYDTHSDASGEMPHAETSTALSTQSHTGPTGKPLTAEAMRDKQILMYAVRYPHRLEDLRNIGADFALSTFVARQLWEKLEAFDADMVFSELNEREKIFWVQCRTGEVPPIDTGDTELEWLTKELHVLAVTEQKNAIAAALRENAGTGDFEADLEYLKLIQESLRKNDA